MKLKLKSTGSKKDIDLGEELKTRKKVIEAIVANVPQPVIKENKIKPSAKKVVYISKHGGKAIFDSVRLCATIFGKDESAIRYKIEHPDSKYRYYNWLKGGKLEYYNN